MSDITAEKSSASVDVPHYRYVAIFDQRHGRGGALYMKLPDTLPPGGSTSMIENGNTMAVSVVAANKDHAEALVADFFASLWIQEREMGALR